MITMHDHYAGQTLRQLVNIMGKCAMFLAMPHQLFLPECAWHWIDIGIIDIPAQDKKTKQFVVIEPKTNQTSDDTIGQLTHYMGWLEEHKRDGAATKGIIYRSAVR